MKNSQLQEGLELEELGPLHLQPTPQSVFVRLRVTGVDALYSPGSWSAALGEFNARFIGRSGWSSGLGHRDSGLNSFCSTCSGAAGDLMAWACQPLEVGESHFAARLLRELLLEAILESQQRLLLACVLAMFFVLLSSHQPIESEASAKVFLATALAGIMAAVPVNGFCSSKKFIQAEYTTFHRSWN